MKANASTLNHGFIQSTGWLFFDNLMLYREVLFQLVGRDLKLKYKRMALGYLWSLLNPLLQLTVLSIVFSHIVRVDLPHYPLFIFSGFLPWTFFHNSLTQSASSFLEAEPFIKKIYLPREIFPLSKTVVTFVDFLFALGALAILALILGYHFLGNALLGLPLALALLFFFTWGCGMAFSVLTVYFRDTPYLLSVGLQMLYFMTPIFYPLDSLPGRYRTLFSCNPVYTQVHLFQQMFYHGTFPSLRAWAAAFLMSLGTFALGYCLLVWRDKDLVFRL